MIDRSQLPNGAFEFVTIAGARARQLLNGSVPRVESDAKPIKIAQQEVVSGLVEKLVD